MEDGLIACGKNLQAIFMLFLFYSVLKIYLLIFFLFSEENLAAIVQWPPGFL